MNIGAYAVALILGISYKKLLGRGNLLFFSLAAAFTALGLGNYPGYPVTGIASTLAFAAIGIIIGELWKR